MSNQLLRVLVVDDELLAREHLRDLLSKQADVEVVALADGGSAAVAAIHQHQPDAVFLDIHMPGMTGFDVIKEIGAEHMPITIFVTAYDRYALKAFDLAAIDYVLKPLDEDRLELAVQRARRLQALQHSGDMAVRIRKAMASVGIEIADGDRAQPSLNYLERMAVESRGQVRVVQIDQVDHITASGVYVELHVADKTYVVRERMQVLEERLNPQHFFRVHRSIIVQLNRIDVLLRQAGGDYTLRLKNGVQLPVSRNRIEQLERWMGVPRSET